jgi:hypothetical protein
LAREKETSWVSPKKKQPKAQNNEKWYYQ